MERIGTVEKRLEAVGKMEAVGRVEAEGKMEAAGKVEAEGKIEAVGNRGKLEHHPEDEKVLAVDILASWGRVLGSLVTSPSQRPPQVCSSLLARPCSYGHRLCRQQIWPPCSSAQPPAVCSAP